MATYPMTVQHQCYLQEAMPRHWSPGASQPPVIPHSPVDYRRGFYTQFYTFSPAQPRVIRDFTPPRFLP